MKAKIILTSLMAMIISFSFAQFDIPPGGIPGFPPDNSKCPPGVYCHPDGLMGFMSNDDADAVAAALDSPEGCCCLCALGKWFSDVIRPLYPPCYPNCNLDTDGDGDVDGDDSSQSDRNNSNANKVKPIAAKGKITAETYNYFQSEFPKRYYSKENKAFEIEGIKGSIFKLTGMYVYFPKAKNEIHMLRIEPIDKKSGASYDKLYLMFNKGHMMIMNYSWIKALKKKKGK